MRSKPKEEDRREAASKFPERFPRKVAVRVNPESCREAEEPGGPIGDCGEGGETPRIVPLVLGRSERGFASDLDWRNALKIGGRGAKPDAPASPKDADARLISFDSVLAGAVGLKICGLSERKASFGNVSMAYCGGPTGTP